MKNNTYVDSLKSIEYSHYVANFNVTDFNSSSSDETTSTELIEQETKKSGLYFT